jgi:hypothetical protein
MSFFIDDSVVLLWSCFKVDDEGKDRSLVDIFQGLDSEYAKVKMFAAFPSKGLASMDWVRRHFFSAFAKWDVLSDDELSSRLAKGNSCGMQRKTVLPVKREIKTRDESYLVGFSKMTVGAVEIEFDCMRDCVSCEISEVVLSAPFCDVSPVSEFVPLMSREKYMSLNYVRYQVSVMRECLVASGYRGFQCSKCCRRLDDDVTCDRAENRDGGRCYLCRPKLSWERGAKFCFVCDQFIVSGMNCSAVQYALDYSRCDFCFSQFNNDEMRHFQRSFHLMKQVVNSTDVLDVAVVDVRLIKRKLISCGITRLFRCCGKIRTSTYWITENMDLIECGTKYAKYGATFEISFGKVLRKIMRLANTCTILYYGDWTRKFLEGHGHTVRKMVDVKQLLQLTSSLDFTISSHLFESGVEAVNSCDPGNHSFYVLIGYLKLLLTMGPVRLTFGELCYVIPLMDVFLASPCAVSDFLDFQLGLALCPSCLTFTFGDPVDKMVQYVHDGDRDAPDYVAFPRHKVMEFYKAYRANWRVVPFNDSLPLVSKVSKFRC